jgi:predicted nucleic acid-binding protein
VILLDTDVLLDVALGREPHLEASAALLDLLERRPYRAFVSWHTLSNLHYLLRPAAGGDDARAFLRDLTSVALVAPTDTDDFRFGADLPLRDLEDAMQVAAARACGARFIATRNVRDYRGSPIQALTPAELLEELG